MQQPEPDNLTDFLIADLEHFGESLWRNEEIGEKRFNFFLTLVTAVIGGLVALHTAETKPTVNTLIDITNGALAGLFILGVLTYLRMLHRNRVTDQYQRTLKHIRGKLLDLSPVPYEEPCQAGSCGGLLTSLVSPNNSKIASNACNTASFNGTGLTRSQSITYRI